MTQIFKLSKKPLGRTANLFTTQLFCAASLSPFKFAVFSIKSSKEHFVPFYGNAWPKIKMYPLEQLTLIQKTV